MMHLVIIINNSDFLPRLPQTSLLEGSALLHVVFYNYILEFIKEWNGMKMNKISYF